MNRAWLEVKGNLLWVSGRLELLRVQVTEGAVNVWWGGDWGLWFCGFGYFFKISFSVFMLKIFHFLVLLFIALCASSIFSMWFLVFVQNFDEYLNLVSDVFFQFFTLGFLFDLSNSYMPLLISNSHETYVAPLVTTVAGRLGFGQLRCANLSL